MARITLSRADQSAMRENYAPGAEDFHGHRSARQAMRWRWVAQPRRIFLVLATRVRVPLQPRGRARRAGLGARRGPESRETARQRQQRWQLRAVGISIGGTGGVIIAVVDGVPLAAGVFNFCPAGPLFGVDLMGREAEGS